MRVVAALLLLATVLAAAASGRRLSRESFSTHRTHYAVPLNHFNNPSRPTTANCTKQFIQQPLDHYRQDVTGATFNQRYFVCTHKDANWTANGTIFFYTGNEANVELFVNMTGLMWENAAEFNAILVFAEHRFFGESLPFPGQAMPQAQDLRTLTSDQALEDYSRLVNFLRKDWKSIASPVIAFGGSYGGMLASWMRIKFPDVIDGSIAGSAPIVNFEDMDPAYNPNAFNDVVTFDATAAGGATAGCSDNVRQAWKDITTLGQSASGRQSLSSIFSMCKPIQNGNDVNNLINYASQCFANFAMSSYPYPSAYLLLGGAGVLPAYPMRVGCKFMGGNFSTAEERLQGFMKMILVYYNATGDFTCLNPDSTVNVATEVVDYLWGYLSCATMLMPFSQNGVTDMFWPSPWNLTSAVEGCVQQYGVKSSVSWPKLQYGGWGVSRWGRNIVFSNGGLDPWRPGGITNHTSWEIDTIIIPDVGHHIDLMFSDEADTEAVKEARKTEVAHMKRWVEEKKWQWK